MALLPNPNFPVITHAIWANPADTGTYDSIIAQASALVTSGKTDGIVDVPDPTPPFDAYRNWVDTDAANAWITFLQGLGDPNLTSVTIKP